MILAKRLAHLSYRGRAFAWEHCQTPFCRAAARLLVSMMVLFRNDLDESVIAALNEMKSDGLL
jgi:hypothetical protein